MKRCIVGGLAAVLIAGGFDYLSAAGQRRLSIRGTGAQQVRWTDPAGRHLATRVAFTQTG